MATTKRTIKIQEVIDALEGIAEWVKDLRAVLDQLPKSTHITMKSPTGGGNVRPMLGGCPPPDDCDEESESTTRRPARRPSKK